MARGLVLSFVARGVALKSILAFAINDQRAAPARMEALRAAEPLTLRSAIAIPLRKVTCAA